jgi:hypothetical protein
VDELYEAVAKKLEADPEAGEALKIWQEAHAHYSADGTTRLKLWFDAILEAGDPAAVADGRVPPDADDDDDEAGGRP